MLTLRPIRIGAVPPTATVYRTVEINSYRCTVCGYIWEDLPWISLPLCHAPAEKFRRSK